MHRTIAEVDPCASRQCNLTVGFSPLRWLQLNYRAKAHARSIFLQLDWCHLTSLRIFAATRDYAESRRRSALHQVSGTQHRGH